MNDLKKLQLANIKPLDIHLDGFAEACFNENSVDELFEALERGFDPTDAKNWKINETQWHEGILNALSFRRFKLEEAAE